MKIDYLFEIFFPAYHAASNPKVFWGLLYGPTRAKDLSENKLIWNVLLTGGVGTHFVDPAIAKDLLEKEKIKIEKLFEMSFSANHTFSHTKVFWRPFHGPTIVQNVSENEIEMFLSGGVGT